MPTADQYVRDLLWAVNAPSFVAGEDVAPERPLTIDEIDGEHLASMLTESGHVEYRVGRYFEQLLQYWFVHLRKVEMVAAGLQLKDGKRTVGEIDFLYRDEAGELVHCEASIKFFLHLAGHSPSEFPGPNATDNYERKVGKLFDKQLRMSMEHVPDVERREGYVKGMMFYRAGADGALEVPAALPARLPATNHSQGQWVRESELEALGVDGSVFSVAPKPYWLAPIANACCLHGSAFVEEMATHFASRRHPLMISVRSDQHPEREVKRVFVVADDWPAHHSAR